MYFVVNRSFSDMSDAIKACSSGSISDMITDKYGTILMKHEEVPIEDIYGMMIAKQLLTRSHLLMIEG
jgi:hypothetical protein